MPLYIWENKKTGQKIEVVRAFSEYEVPPTEEESGVNPQDAEWERKIGRVLVTRNYTGSKGNW